MNNYHKYHKYKKKYLKLLGSSDINNRLDQILLAYMSTEDYLVFSKYPHLFNFVEDGQNEFYRLVVEKILNNELKLDNRKYIVQYFTTCEEFNIRSECLVSLYYKNAKWLVIPQIKKGSIKVNLNNMWIVFLLQDGSLTGVPKPGELYKILTNLGLIMIKGK